MLHLTDDSVEAWQQFSEYAPAIHLFQGMPNASASLDNLQKCLTIAGFSAHSLFIENELQIRHGKAVKTSSECPDDVPELKRPREFFQGF